MRRLPRANVRRPGASNPTPAAAAAVAPPSAARVPAAARRCGRCVNARSLEEPSAVSAMQSAIGTPPRRRADRPLSHNRRRPRLRMSGPVPRESWLDSGREEVFIDGQRARTRPERDRSPRVQLGSCKDLLDDGLNRSKRPPVPANVDLPHLLTIRRD